MDSIRLYSQAMNPFGEKVAQGLALKRRRYELVEVNDPAEIKRLNPLTGLLPVLEIDGQRRGESQKILEWLEELYPEPSMYASDPQVREAQRRLADWSDTSLLWYWDRWRAARYPRPGDEKPPAEGLLSKLRGRLENRPAPTRADLREFEVTDEMAHRLDDLLGFLGNRPFFHADEPSGADLSVNGMLSTIRNGPMIQGESLLAARPALLEYMERVDKALAPASGGD